jgi:hypothetical protein
MDQVGHADGPAARPPAGPPRPADAVPCSASESSAGCLPSAPGAPLKADRLEACASVLPAVRACRLERHSATPRRPSPQSPCAGFERRYASGEEPSGSRCAARPQVRVFGKTPCVLRSRRRRWVALSRQVRLRSVRRRRTLRAPAKPAGRRPHGRARGGRGTPAPGNGSARSRTALEGHGHRPGGGISRYGARNRHSVEPFPPERSMPRCDGPWRREAPRDAVPAPRALAPARSRSIHAPRVLGHDPVQGHAARC